MYEECQVTLKMERMILRDGYFDEKIHRCKIITYHPEEESIYLLSEDTELPVFSLDGIYECRIETKNGMIGCTGCIRERYWNKLGRVIRYQIKNGFYKNLVN